MEYEERFVRDPRICGGETVAKGTRVTLPTILASLAEDATVEEILKDFPTLSEEDVRAASLLPLHRPRKICPCPASRTSHEGQA